VAKRIGTNGHAFAQFRCRPSGMQGGRGFNNRHWRATASRSAPSGSDKVIAYHRLGSAPLLYGIRGTRSSYAFGFSLSRKPAAAGRSLWSAPLAPPTVIEVGRVNQRELHTSSACERLNAISNALFDRKLASIAIVIALRNNIRINAVAPAVVDNPHLPPRSIRSVQGEQSKLVCLRFLRPSRGESLSPLA
jgi:hypothetical protein